MNEIKDKFYIGDYSKVAAEGGKSMDEETEFVVLRSRIMIGQADFVINSTKALDTPMKQGVNLLARAKKLNSPTEIGELLKTITDDGGSMTSHYYAICKATLHSQIGNIIEALRTLNNIDHPEASALRIHCYLNINRTDLAKNELEKLSNSTLGMIWKAFVGLYLTKEDIQSALYSLQDLSERYKMTPLLSNAIACCHFALGEWETAQMILNNASETYPNDETIIINSAVSLQRTPEIEKLQTQMTLLSEVKNKYTEALNEMLQDFDATASRLTSQ